MSYQFPLSPDPTTPEVPVRIHIIPVAMHVAPVGVNPGPVGVNHS